MEDKISKFLIAKKDGKLRYHKTDLLNRLLAIHNGQNWQTYTKNGGSRYCIVKDKLFAFGTTVFIGETLGGLILFTLKKSSMEKDKIKIFVTPEFVEKQNQTNFNKAIKKFPEVEIKKLNFSENKLYEALNDIAKKDNPIWRDVKGTKEITYIDLKSNLEHFDFFINEYATI